METLRSKIEYLEGIINSKATMVSGQDTTDVIEAFNDIYEKLLEEESALAVISLNLDRINSQIDRINNKLS